MKKKFYNDFGMKVLDKSVTSGNEVIEIESFSKGIYFITVIS